MRKVNKVVAAAIAASMMVLSVSGLFTANEISKDDITPSSESVQMSEETQPYEELEDTQISISDSEEETGDTQTTEEIEEKEESQEAANETFDLEEASQPDEITVYDEELKTVSTTESRKTNIPPDFVHVNERNWDITGTNDPGFGNYVSYMEEAFFNGYMNIDGVNTSTGNNIIIWGSPTNGAGTSTTVGDCVPGYTFEDYEGYYFNTCNWDCYRNPTTNIKKVGEDKSKWSIKKNCFIIMHKPESLDENGYSELYKYIYNPEGRIRTLSLDFDYSKVSGNGNFGTAYVMTTYDMYVDYVPESRNENIDDFQKINKYTTWNYYDNWDIEKISKEENFINTGYKTSKIVFVKDDRIIKIIPGCETNAYNDTLAWFLKDEELYWQQGVDYDYALRIKDDWMQTGDEVFYIENQSFNLFGLSSLIQDPGVMKEENSLQPIDVASTKDKIHVNMYDYDLSKTPNVNNYENGIYWPYLPLFRNEAKGYFPKNDNFNMFTNIGNKYTKDYKYCVAVFPSTDEITVNSTQVGNAKKPFVITHGYGTGIKSQTINGYPAINAKGKDVSLEYLFTDNEYSNKVNTEPIDGLFQYDEETGNYYFDSKDNGAVFNNETNQFDLYNEKLTANYLAYPYGNFFPFNDINDAVKSSKIGAQAMKDYCVYMFRQAFAADNDVDKQQNLEASKTLSQMVNLMSNTLGNENFTAAQAATRNFEYLNKVNSAFPAKQFTDEDLDDVYTIPYYEQKNFFFSMETNCFFIMPENGMGGKDNKYPVKLSFKGDDDFTLFIDGYLVVDLSGVHQAQAATVNFKEGKVYYYAPNPATIEIDESNPIFTMDFSEIFPEEMLENGTLIKNTTHYMQSYYMERGAGSGVLHLEFNFPVEVYESVHPNLLLQKEMNSACCDGKNPEVDCLEGMHDSKYEFQVVLTNKTTGEKLYANVNTSSNTMIKHIKPGDWVITELWENGSKADINDVDISISEGYETIIFKLTNKANDQKEYREQYDVKNYFAVN